MSIRRNTLVNLVGQVVPIAVILLTVPPYLALIGEARYGVLTICWMLLGYFGLFNFGLSTATAQRMACLRESPPEQRGRLLWTALALSLGLGISAAAVFWGGGQLFLARYLPSGGGLRQEVFDALPWLAVSLPVGILSSVLAGALQGRERFVALTLTQALGAVLSQLLPLTVAWLQSPDLPHLIPAAIMGRLLVFQILFTLCRNYVPLHRRPSVDRASIRPLFSFGGWVAVSSILAQLLHGTDRIVIGAVAGARAVTYYSVPFGLVSRAMIFPGSLSSALFPRFASLSDDRRIDLAAEAIRVICLVMAPLIVIGLFAMEPFLAAWINVEFAQRSARVGEIMLVGLWAISLAHIPYVLSQARGRPDIVAKLHLIELVPYFAMLYGGLVCWGATGAAVAWTLRGVIATVILFGLVRTARATLQPVIFPTLLVIGSAAATFSLPYAAPSRWVCAAALLIISAVWVWNTAPPSVRNLLPTALRRSPRLDSKEVES